MGQSCCDFGSPPQQLDLQAPAPGESQDDRNDLALRPAAIGDDTMVTVSDKGRNLDDMCDVTVQASGDVTKLPPQAVVPRAEPDQIVPVPEIEQAGEAAPHADSGSQAIADKEKRQSTTMHPTKKRVSAIGAVFPRRPAMCVLSEQLWAKGEELFRAMDADQSNAVTRAEAQEFFKGAFKKASMEAMFNEVDRDNSGAITAEEFMNFWKQVKSSGYSEADMLDEMEELLKGSTWVDWNDGRDTAPVKTEPFPKRPWLCRLSKQTWKKCEDLFRKMAGDDSSLMITEEKAARFFKGNFSKMSVQAMFNEVDQNHHGQITPKAFMDFWVQVKGSGYKERDILAELDGLMEGGAWVDWKDGRRT